MKQFYLIGALPESLINFRGELLRRLVAHDYTVTAMASSVNPQVTSKLSEMKVTFKLFPIQRNGLNPFSDVFTWLFLRKYFKKSRPDIVLAYTIKPIIWGGLAKKTTPNTHFYALITGLGFAFQGKSWKRRILTKLTTSLYKASLKNAKKVIFQNPDNLQEFISRGIIPQEKCELVNGSGVDIEKFSYTPLPEIQQITF
ncbi:MAG: glycosyltransferase family 1 protein, partial [Cocleimonas sp.]|nr:glycosyltransferase family 1 protein [Cocleimonas sp.]